MTADDATTDRHENPMALPAVVALVSTLASAWTLLMGVSALIGFAVVTVLCFLGGVWWRSRDDRHDEQEG